MAILSFFVHLFGAVFLLLYAVRMVRTGIERAFGSSFKRLFLRAGGAFRSAATGIGLAVVLQSSAAVALLAAGFAAAGLISFPAGLAIVLGADMGSALLVQILSHPLNWLTPVLLTVGGALFVKSERRSFKQAARVMLGIAFILISLRFLREAMDPIRAAEFLPAITGYLERDATTAFLVGAALAWLMHSSVAVILMCVTLVSVGTLPVEAGISLTLGANLGSAIIPVWLSRQQPNAARRIPLANLMLRGSWAIFALAVFRVGSVPLGPSGISDGQTLVNAHLLFNFAMVLLLPFVRWLERPMLALLPDEPVPAGAFFTEQRSVLDDAQLDRPRLALTCLRREVLRMSGLCSHMFEAVWETFETSDRTRAKALVTEDKHLNLALDGVRRYAARIDLDGLDADDADRVRELTEYAIAIESAGDVIVKRLVPRVVQKSSEGITFSPEGAAEISRMYDLVTANMPLASAVVISDDPENARLLIEGKSEIGRFERQSRMKHLQRLSGGSSQSFESSNVHLETLKALKDFNSLIASAAYPILHRSGQLLESRLIDEIRS